MENEKIYLHYDMDAFFASIEQRDNPSLRGKAIAVGSGVVTTASYEARKFGVKSAMAMANAKRLCPHLKVVYPRKNFYFLEGEKIQNLIKKVIKIYEFTSVDEGYLDITQFILAENQTRARKISKIKRFIKKFKEYIYKNMNLTCSVGIGFSKVSAKIASDANKPNGFFIFEDKNHFVNYIFEKDFSIIPGIGKKTKEILNFDFGATKVSQLYEISRNELIRKFGASRGEYIYDVIRGEHFSKINVDKKRKSYGYEITFNQNVNEIYELQEELRAQVEKICQKLKEKKEFVKTITVKIKYSDFTGHTRSKTLENTTNDEKLIYKVALENFSHFVKKDEVRLIGIYVSNIFKRSFIQLKLIDET